MDRPLETGRACVRSLYNIMSSSNQKLRLAGALAVLATLVLAVSCQGFFPKATLQSITISPQSPQVLLNTANQAPLQVWGTDSNNHRYQITSGVNWSTDPTGVISIDPNTFVPDGQSLTTTTITADTQGLTATATGTVTVGCISKIAITPLNPNPISINNGDTIQFLATATTCNGSQDITAVATWVSSNTSAATVSTTGLVSPVGTGVTTITANSDGITSNSVSVTVTQ